MGEIFGTDGVRDVAGQGLLTPESVLRLGKAIGKLLVTGSNGSAGRPRVLVGRDPRISGATLEASLTAGLLSAGADVTSTGILPTPAIQLLTREGDYDLGVVVSASHNPYHDNGIKIVGANGEKLPDESENEIERSYAGLADAVAGATERQNPARFGQRTLEAGAQDLYVSFLIERRFAGLRLDGMRIVLDCANGAGSDVAPRVLTALGADLVIVHASPDGLNINSGCGALHPEILQAACRKSKASFGITLDGDGDRALLVDEEGQIRDGDHILGVLALHLKGRGRLDRETVVATVMSNVGLESFLTDNGIRLLRVPVGDRHVVQQIRDQGYRLGGEQSGHIIVNDGCGLYGDGLATALHVLEAMTASSARLADLASPVQKFPQILVNIRVRERPELLTLPTVGSVVRDV
jgi:phosphoglucosamine mutase